MNAEDPQPKRPRKWLRRVGKAILALVGIVVFLHLPIPPPRLVISRQTTYIDGPLKADGTPDYVAAVDGMVREGVTPDNNAAYLLLEALGPEVIPEKVRAETYRRLAMDPLPEQGQYFMSWQDWLEANPPPKSPATQSAGAPDAQPGDVPETLSQSQWDPDPRRAQLDDAIRGPWTPKDKPELALWLGQQRAALEKVLAACDKARFYLPVISSASDASILGVSFLNLSRCRVAAKALAAGAMLKLAQGQIEQAWADILAVHRLTRLLEQGNTLIHHLLGTGTEAVAGRGGAALASSARVSAGQARAMLAQLDALSPRADMKQAMLYERFEFADSIIRVSRGRDTGPILDCPEWIAAWVGRPRAFDLNVMLREVNSWHDLLERDVTGRGPSARAQARRDLTHHLTATKQRQGLTLVRVFLYRCGGWPCRKAFSRALTEMLMGMLSPNYSRAADHNDEAAMSCEVERTAFALAAHKVEKGAYPKSLDALVPEYLARVPVDVFSDKPLIYRQEASGYVLYSVASNRTDDGGPAPPPGPGEAGRFDPTRSDDVGVVVKP